LIAERSFPWTRIFMDFENLLPEGARITSISPRLKDGHIELMLKTGATSDEAGMKFVHALETSRSFSHIEVTSQTHPERSTSVDQVLYELTAWYSAADAPKANVQLEPHASLPAPVTQSGLNK
jgi:Tfp pilus assembly protein PilN